MIEAQPLIKAEWVQAGETVRSQEVRYVGFPQEVWLLNTSNWNSLTCTKDSDIPKVRISSISNAGK